jgi:protease I
MNTKTTITYLLITLSAYSSQDFSIALKNHQKNIALIVAHKDYHPVEYAETKRVIQQAGFSVKTVSTQSGYAYATDRSRTLVDKALNKFKPLKFDGIFIIGGPGAHTELDTKHVHEIMRQAYSAGKVIGAICYSPRILARAGVLKHKHATGWNGDQQLEAIFKKYEVYYDQKPVVIDDKIITADGPSSAADFGKAIVALLGHTR